MSKVKWIIASIYLLLLIAGITLLLRNYNISDFFSYEFIRLNRDLILDYKNENGLNAGLFFNIQGKTLEVVGTGFAPDVYTQPFESLNLNLSKSLGENQNKIMTVKIENILDSKKQSVYVYPQIN